MKIEFNFGSEVFVLPSSVMKYIDKTDALGIKILMFVFSCKGAGNEFSISDIAREFASTEKEISDALAFWERAGVLSLSESAAGKRKTVDTKHKSENGNVVTVRQAEGSISYTGDELSRIFTERPPLSHMMDECSAIAGKVFSVSESNKIVGLVDYLRLEPEYVLMLFTYCKKIDKCSVHYVEKMAYELCNEGIVTYTALEASLAEMEKHRSFESRVRNLMGLGSRALTATEKKYLKLWCDLAVADELLVLAYDTSVNNTGAPSMPYMNKVLSNWREAGYQTKDDVARASEEYKKKKEAAESSFTTDEFFEAALKRSYEALEKGTK